jgi:hypothetical protein
MLIILGTWEAEICRITVPDQPRSKRKRVCETPVYWKKVGCGGVHLSSQQQWEPQNKRIMVQPSLGKEQDPVSKITRAKRSGGTCLARAKP